MKTSIFFALIFVFSNFIAFSQTGTVPKVYKNIKIDKTGKFYYEEENQKFYEYDEKYLYSIKKLQGNPVGDATGILLDFKAKELTGKITYGFIDYANSKHPVPVWFKRSAYIKAGKTKIDIKKNLSGRYDMIHWEKNGYGVLSFRIFNKKNEILYDGIVSFKYENKKFIVTASIIDGPHVSKLTSNSVVIWFNTDKAIKANIEVESKKFSDTKATTHHEIEITGLQPNKTYEYTVNYDGLKQKYTFKTAPKTGSRKPFVFAYASDSRAGNGGGERDFNGANAYIAKKIMALASYNNAAFLQFTGDMINGYSSSIDRTELEYANWKRAIEPFSHHFPVIATVGNHEVIGKRFVSKEDNFKQFVTGFPFETESSAAVFANNFVNPENGPLSEDNSACDPDKSTIDFPPYSETVFYYTYDNVAVVVLNSNYLYTPTLTNDITAGGNLHGYIMDNQLKWLEETILKLEKDKNVDHIFVTQHTPAFPNGGHVGDDMWYYGNNKFRPIIAGKKVEKGIIERRDQYLDILINKSTKVVAILTGDEHNYNKVKISPDVNIYPKNYKYNKFKRNRTIWQINNGAAGAPYYAQDKSTPWTKAVSGFSTQNALVLFYVEGKKVKVKVLNPDTFETVDEYTLRK